MAESQWAFGLSAAKEVMTELAKRGSVLVQSVDPSTAAVKAGRRRLFQTDDGHTV